MVGLPDNTAPPRPALAIAAHSDHRVIKWFEDLQALYVYAQEQGILVGSALQPADIGVLVQGYSAVLDATTASYTVAEQTKLAGITPVLSGLATVTPALGSWSHIETVAAVGVLPGDMIFLALGSHDDAAENTPELLDIAAISGTAETDQITVTLAFSTETSGPINLNWSAM